MKKSLCFQSALVLLLCITLLVLLLWAAAVPLEQIQQYAGEKTGQTGDRVAFQENLDQVATLLWSAIAFTAVIGFVIPWMVFRRVLTPVVSIRNTIGQVTRGDLEARIQVDTGNELEDLAYELNRMTEDRKQEQEQLLGINRTLSAISACRHVMIHEADENQLNQKICQTLVDIGTYRIAWICYAENDMHGTLTPAALAGYHNGNLNAVPESRAETACNPSARAIRNRYPAIISNVFEDPLFTPLQAEAVRHGYASVIALPLTVNQRMLGAITLYAGKPGAFGTEAVRLLTELADDLAYGILAVRYSGKKMHIINRQPEKSKS